MYVSEYESFSAHEFSRLKELFSEIARILLRFTA
jgi:hypothetical protein